MISYFTIVKYGKYQWRILRYFTHIHIINQNIEISPNPSNRMVSSTIWIKNARVSFWKTIKLTRVRRTSAIWSLWKTHECMFFQINASHFFYKKTPVIFVTPKIFVIVSYFKPIRKPNGCTDLGSWLRI
jgi:hypothetical protein